MSRRQLTYMVGITVLAIAGLLGTFAAGNEPLLGLDLQGGVEVRYQATEETTTESLDQAVEIIRSRVDSLGVAEPEISRVDEGILVQLPGVKDTDRALELVGATAELEFRPVLRRFNASATLADVGIDDPVEYYDDIIEANATTVPPATTVDPDEETAASPTETTVPPSTLPPTTTTLLETDEEKTEFIEGLFGVGQSPDLTDLTDDDGTTNVIMAEYDEDENEVGRYELGPIGLKGEGLTDASAVLQGIEWVVAPEFKSGDEGINAFNRIATACFNQDITCSVGAVAIALDGRVISAPQVNAPQFGRDQITISGGPFSEQEAKDLAVALRFGALPVELEPEQQRVVSGSLGDDALNAGMIAGLIGLVLVAVYIIWYYRVLGGVAIASLLISGALLWTIISWLGTNQGLALTLAGITGLIVSIGVSVDSNIVYFEHIKEDMRNGRTLGSSVERAFPIAFSTIVKADVASLIAAVLLYALTSGAVRGFAFYLGLATLLDLVATYFFMGPAVKWLAARFGDNPKAFGVGALAAAGEIGEST